MRPSFFEGLLWLILMLAEALPAAKLPGKTAVSLLYPVPSKKRVLLLPPASDSCILEVVAVLPIKSFTKLL